jgi:hypothetical protein
MLGQQQSFSNIWKSRKPKVKAKFISFLNCHDIWNIYGVPKFITVYLVKWQVFRIQQASGNSLFAPSVKSSSNRTYRPSNKWGGLNKGWLGAIVSPFYVLVSLTSVLGWRQFNTKSLVLVNSFLILRVRQAWAREVRRSAANKAIRRIRERIWNEKI